MEPEFMKEVASAISVAGEILVIGPGNAKTEFMTYVEKHDPKLKAKILGVETVDHPSDGEIVAYARKFFKPVDEMLPRWISNSVKDKKIVVHGLTCTIELDISPLFEMEQTQDWAVA